MMGHIDKGGFHRLPPTTLSSTATAQARYALHEKLLRCQESFANAQSVFPEDSPNVAFWALEVARVAAALREMGGPA